MSQQTEVKESPALANALPRFAAAMKLESLPEPEATALAVEYNLMSPFTNFLAVLERAESEKTGELPQLRTVEHNIPRGWGGIDRNILSDAIQPCMSICRKELYLEEPRAHIEDEDPLWIKAVISRTVKYLESSKDIGITFVMLKGWGLPEEIYDALSALLQDTHLGVATAQADTKTIQTTETAISLLLVLLAAKREASIKRDDMRLLRQAMGKFALDTKLKASVEDVLDAF